MIKVNIFSNKVIKQAGKLCAYFSCLSIMCLFSVASYGMPCNVPVDPNGTLELHYPGPVGVLDPETCIYSYNTTNKNFKLNANLSTRTNSPCRVTVSSRENLQDRANPLIGIYWKNSTSSPKYVGANLCDFSTSPSCGSMAAIVYPYNNSSSMASIGGDTTSNARACMTGDSKKCQKSYDPNGKLQLNYYHGSQCVYNYNNTNTLNLNTKLSIQNGCCSTNQTIDLTKNLQNLCSTSKLTGVGWRKQSYTPTNMVYSFAAILCNDTTDPILCGDNTILRLTSGQFQAVVETDATFTRETGSWCDVSGLQSPKPRH